MGRPVSKSAGSSTSHGSKVQDTQGDERRETNKTEGKGTDRTKGAERDAKQARDHSLLKSEHAVREQEELAKVGKAGRNMDVVAQDVERD